MISQIGFLILKESLQTRQLPHPWSDLNYWHTSFAFIDSGYRNRLITLMFCVRIFYKHVGLGDSRKKPNIFARHLSTRFDVHGIQVSGSSFTKNI